MRFTLEIDSDNEDDSFGVAVREITSRLENVIAHLDAGYWTATIRDSNGNTVGKWELS